MKPVVTVSVVAIVFVIFLFAGCGGDSGNASVESRQFLFGMKDDPEGKLDFVSVTSNTAVIAAAYSQLALPVSERGLHINGKIGQGSGGHNLEWNWHFTPDEWTLAGVSIELCDGSPAMVEQDLAYWLGTVGRFCPWVSYVKGELPSPKK